MVEVAEQSNELVSLDGHIAQCPATLLMFIYEVQELVELGAREVWQARTRVATRQARRASVPRASTLILGRAAGILDWRSGARLRTASKAGKLGMQRIWVEAECFLEMQKSV